LRQANSELTYELGRIREQMDEMLEIVEARSGDADRMEELESAVRTLQAENQALARQHKYELDQVTRKLNRKAASNSKLKARIGSLERELGLAIASREARPKSSFARSERVAERGRRKLSTSARATAQTPPRTKPSNTSSPGSAVKRNPRSSLGASERSQISEIDQRLHRLQAMLKPRP
jgi:hypothetical protein